MSRPTKTGVRGLFRDKNGSLRIDLRWQDARTGEHRRYQERLPKAIPMAAAKRRAQEILGGTMAGTFVTKDERPRTLHELFDEYVLWAKTNRPRTYRDRVLHLQLLRRYLRDSSLDQVSALDVERLKRAERSLGKAPATVNRVLATLKHAIAYGARQLGWVTPAVHDAVRAVKLFREPPGRVRYLSAEEEQALLAAVHGPLRDFVMAALFTGMRLSEISTLRKSQVDLQRRVITIGDVTPTKTGRVRRIPIAEPLAPTLERAIRESPCDHVFLNARGTAYKSGNTVSSAFAAAAKTAGLTNLRFHDLRHDFASRLRRHNVGLDVIAQLLGHSSLAMTMRYAHIDDPTMRNAIDALAKVGA
jgi:integrase